MRAESSGAPDRCVPGVEGSERALDGERCAHGALGVVLLRLRIAEQGHQPVAELLQDMAAESRHRGRRFVEIGADQVAPVLGVEPRREARRAGEIAEHHGDRPALGGVFDGPLRRRRTLPRRGEVRRGRRVGQSGDGRKQPAPVADRGDADVPEVVRRQLRQDVRVDPVVSKVLLVLTETETAKPPADVHGRAPHGITRLTGVISRVQQRAPESRTLRKPHPPPRSFRSRAQYSSRLRISRSKPRSTGS